ncbi:MAG TPA: alpha/beta hydrolase, partial [Saprospiraceae bacterium]|nr:alpha/beta hydrolase [Saprospiraceae bacterium]
MNSLPTLILLHGALGSETQFTPLKSLLTNDFSVYTLDFAGHGGRALPDHFSIEHFSSELHRFIENHELTNVNIFGYSMGGYVALHLASIRPEHIARIMTLGTMLKWNPEIAEREVRQLNPETIETKVPKWAEQLRQRHAPQDWKIILRKTAEMMTELGTGTAMPLDEFKKIKIPVLITLGTMDQIVSREECLEVVNLLSQGQFHAFEGFKHPIEMADFTILAKKIKSF